MAASATNGTERAAYDMGAHTHAVPMELFVLNRRRLAARLADLSPGGVVLLQAGKTCGHDDTDTEYLFRQESFFMWTFGVAEADCYGAVEVSSGRSHLFIPRLPLSYAVWMGRIQTPQEYAVQYQIDDVHYIDQMPGVLKALKPDPLLTLYGENTDSGKTCTEAFFQGIDEFSIDKTILHPEIVKCRVLKTPLEVEVLRYVNKLSSDAHKSVMRKVRPGMYEYQGEATFLHYIYYVGGSRYTAYSCICGSGHNAATLHYGHAGAPNDKKIGPNDMCLFDMGASYCGYASDITVSFPANGKFTDMQKNIYNAVLSARNAVIGAIKPGVSWVDMHKLANKVMLKEMRKCGILQGDVDAMLDAGLAAIFQPHGLGHLMGCDVHDVGGYTADCPPRPTQPGLDKLRTARDLEPGMVITVEPGCYFIECLLERAIADSSLSKFLCMDAIHALKGFGGVRIEDDILVTEFGAENMTQVPRTVEEIEDWMGQTPQSQFTHGNEPPSACPMIVTHF